MVLWGRINYCFVYCCVVEVFELVVDSYEGSVLGGLKEVEEMEGRVGDGKVMGVLGSD